MRVNVEADINNIYRELGMIRCEIEQLHDRERRDFLVNHRNSK